MSWEFGLRRALLLRRERVDLGLGLRLLYASDLHLRPSQAHHIAEELLLAARAVRPDAILLGGDLVDVADALPKLASLVGSLGNLAPAGAVSGNHDLLVGRERVRQTVLSAGGQWLEDLPMKVGGLQILGSSDQVPDSGPWLFCAHYPTSFPSARRAGARLVLAGHLHGWQIVLGQWREYLLPGALLSRWNGLRFEREGSTLIVSRGMTDFFPLRWNCPREVVALYL